MPLFGHTFRRSPKKARETDNTVAAAVAETRIKKVSWIRNPRHIMSAFTKRPDRVSGKLPNKKSKGKNKEIELGGESDIEHSPSAGAFLLRRPWNPVFQSKPPSSCNCLKLKPDHGFSYREIQKMRWFIDRMVQQIAQPEDWLEEETHFAAEQEIQVWSIMHPLMLLKYYAISFSLIESAGLTCLSRPSLRSGDWTIVHVPSTRAQQFVHASQLWMAKSILQDQSSGSPAPSEARPGIHIASGVDHAPDCRPMDTVSSPTPAPATFGFLPTIKEEYSPHWTNAPEATSYQPSFGIVAIRKSTPPNDGNLTSKASGKAAEKADEEAAEEAAGKAAETESVPAKRIRRVRAIKINRVRM